MNYHCDSESLQDMKQISSSQEQFIAILKSSLKEAKLSLAGKLKMMINRPIFT